MSDKDVRQLGAIMFTDIEGYTALMGVDESAAITMRTRHRQVFKEVHKNFNGRIIQYFGDGTLSIFNSSKDAVEAAIEMQKEFMVLPFVPLRIGIHTGEVTISDQEIIGDSVNVASRIESTGVSGSILISDKVHDDIKNQTGIELQSLGFFEFKNVDKSREIYAITNNDLVVPDEGMLGGKKSKRVDTTNIETSELDHISKSPDNSIAVMPFINMSSDPEQNYFCDGLSEEILNLLGLVGKLKVAARTSSFAFRDTNYDMVEIGEKLGVNNILEGSVRKAQDQLRISVKLVNVVDGFQLWTERYDRKVIDIFDIQDEISEAILKALKFKLLGEEKVKIFGHDTKNPEAYQHYLRGRLSFHKYTPEGYKEAIEHYNSAIGLDNAYAKAYAGLASCYLELWHFNYLAAEESLPLLKKATIKSYELDNELAESHLAMARLNLWYEFDFEESKKEFEEVLKINPNIADALVHYGILRCFLGNNNIALLLGAKAMELDPYSPMTNLNFAWILWLREDYAMMREQCDKMIDLNPNFWGGHYVLSIYHWTFEKYDEAIESMKIAVKNNPSPLTLGTLACIYGIADDKEKSNEVIDQLNDLSGQLQGANFYFAMAYAGLGKMDMAFEYLSKAKDERTGHWLFLNKYSKKLIRSFSEDPRLEQYLSELGFPTD